MYTGRRNTFLPSAVASITGATATLFCCFVRLCLFMLKLLRGRLKRLIQGLPRMWSKSSLLIPYKLSVFLNVTSLPTPQRWPCEAVRRSGRASKPTIST